MDKKKCNIKHFVKLDCYIIAECKTEPREDGPSTWSAQCPKAPR